MLYSLIFTFSLQQHIRQINALHNMKHLCGNGSVSVLPNSVYVFVEVFLCSNSRPYSLTSSLCINRILKYTLYIKNTRDSNGNNSSSTTRSNDNDDDNNNINSVYRSESHLKWSQCIWFMENLGHTQPRRDNNDHRAYTVWLKKNKCSSTALLFIINVIKTITPLEWEQNRRGMGSEINHRRNLCFK